MTSNPPIPTNTITIIAGLLCCLMVVVVVAAVVVFVILRNRKPATGDQSISQPVAQPGAVVQASPRPPQAQPKASAVQSQPYFQSQRGLPTQLQAYPAMPAQPSQQLPARLIVTAGFPGQVVWDLPSQGIVLGRQVDCGIMLDDPIASRHHARLDYSEGIWYVTDLNSKNGTHVNGERIIRIELHSGDKIQIGQTTLMFLGGKPKS